MSNARNSQYNNNNPPPTNQTNGASGYRGYGNNNNNKPEGVNAYDNSGSMGPPPKKFWTGEKV